MKTAYALLASLALVVAFGAPAVAQGADFSGTWQLDQDASEIPQFGGGGGRGGGQGGRGATLVIAQTNDVLTIEQQADGGGRTVSYNLDGSESTNAGPRGEQTTTSRWDGEVLLTEGTMRASTPRGDFSMELIERRTLSSDGRTMTVESTRSTPRGDVTARLVYNKATT